MMNRIRTNRFLCCFIFIIAGAFLCLSEETQENGEVLSAVAPVYPLLAYRARAHGVIQVEIEVDSVGTVIDAKVVESRNALLFGELCEQAARKWKFAAAADKSGLRKYRILYRFVLMPEYAKEKDLGVTFISPLEMEIRVKKEPIEPLPPTQNPVSYFNP